nr:immunoglobulin heavy chain junction region [Macaca mulatta]
CARGLYNSWSQFDSW